jgi:hypothetical protein
VRVRGQGSVSGFLVAGDYRSQPLAEREVSPGGKELRRIKAKEVRERFEGRGLVSRSGACALSTWSGE